MVQLAIQLQPEPVHDTCALCGQATGPDEGPQLVTADGAERVCRRCGQKYAPSLVSLLDLAGTAQRVGRIRRHTLFPPLTALLDLARAAEDYNHASPANCQQVS
jgi:hypothetical protein